jgi:hypothetical protein
MVVGTRAIHSDDGLHNGRLRDGLASKLRKVVHAVPTTAITAPSSLSPRAQPSIAQATAVLFFAFMILLLREKTMPAERPASLPSPVSSQPFLTHVVVTVYSYDRPTDLYRLLTDISDRSSSGLRVAVHVLDDNSLSCQAPSGPASSNFFEAFQPDFPLPITQLIPSHLSESDPLAACTSRRRFRHVEALIRRNEALGWKLFVSHYRHGRRRYWHLVHMSHALLRSYSMSSPDSVLSSHVVPYFLFLPDDVRLASDFFERATRAWDSVEDDRKLTLMLHIEASREHAAVWTDLQPIHVTDDLIRIGWVESGNFIARSEFLDFFNWSFPRVPIQRWVDNPPISSGVGAHMSEVMHSAGRTMYRTHTSLLAHVGVTLSKMNAAFRDVGKPAHRTLYFVDGDDVYEQLLLQAATVTASIASVWYREAALHASVDSLAPQVDHINVYLNGYDVVPAYLRVPYVTALLSSDSPLGDIGDVGKFYWADQLRTEFHVTADDDIVYPDDYVQVMIGYLTKSFLAPAIVGLHGIIIEQDLLLPANGRRGKGYYGSRRVFMGVEDVLESHNVHILGTGTVVYRVSDLNPLDVPGVFQSANMADIWLGIRAQELSLPMVVMPHVGNWITTVDGTFGDSIYTQATKGVHRKGDRSQTAATISIAPWKLNPPKVLASVAQISMS